MSAEVASTTAAAVADAKAPVSDTPEAKEKGATSSKGSAPAPGPSTKKKSEIRYHPRLPYSYEVTQYNDLYTVVKRLGRQKDSQSLSKRLEKKMAYYRKMLPLLFRFFRETLSPIGKRRMLLYLLGSMFVAWLPSWQTKAAYKLTELTRLAIETGKLDTLKIARATALDIGVWLVQKAIEAPLERNRQYLQYRFTSIIKKQILLARVRLDSVTSADEKVRGKMRSAEVLARDDWSSAFALERFVKMASSLTMLVSECLLVLELSSAGDGKIAAIAFASDMLFSLRRYLGDSGMWWQYVSAITNPTYIRMSSMETLAKNGSAQDQLLGLRSYYLTEYEKASLELGDLDRTEPDTETLDYGAVWKNRFFELLQKGNRTAIDLLLTVHTMNKKTTSAFDTSAALSNLYLLISSTSRVSHTIVDLLKTFTDVGKLMQPIEHFYAIQILAPLLSLPKDPVRYSQDALSTVLDTQSAELCEDSSESGQDTLVNPSIAGTPRLPAHSSLSALDSVSFTIEGGTLCSIVGQSGSGKSTLIALLVRLHDCDEGNIYINEVDVKLYDPEDLYSRISYLFQHTSRADLTIREFIAMGNTQEVDNKDRILEAAKESGADEVIKKFKHGLDSELSARHYWDDSIKTDLLVKRAQSFDEWEAAREGRVDDVEASDNEKDESTDEDSRKILFAALDVPMTAAELARRTKTAIGWRLPAPLHQEAEILAEGYNASKLEDNDTEESVRCSGGEWAKIVLARTFLRPDVDLTVIDEFSAALDPVSEATIFRKLLARQGTKIAVTHRFHLAVKSDKIFMMSKGKLVEQGSHAELMAKTDGEYRKMYECTTDKGGRKEVATQTDSVSSEDVDLKAEDDAMARDSEPSAGIVTSHPV